MESRLPSLFIDGYRVERQIRGMKTLKKLEFADKTVLVTGASTGIGAAFARELSRRGATLVLVARSGERLARLADELGRAHVLIADLSSPGAARRVHEAVLAKGIEIDVLVNNAGFGLHGPFEVLPLAAQREEIDLNIGALVELSHVFLPMIERRQGGIIQVASMAAYVPVPYMAVYAATKAFVLSFSAALWAEYRERGVRILALVPGATGTSFFERAGEGAAAGAKKARPEDVARVGLAAFVAGRASVVHGTANSVFAALSRFSSRALTAKLFARLMKPKAPLLQPQRSQRDGQNDHGSGAVSPWSASSSSRSAATSASGSACGTSNGSWQPGPPPAR
jgi:short-subunit dehydrogenase